MAYLGDVFTADRGGLIQRIAFAVLVLTVFIMAPAHAQTSRETCAGTSEAADSRIAACTEIIQDQSTSAVNRAVAYNDRGGAYHIKVRDDLAIADAGATAALLQLMR